MEAEFGSDDEPRRRRGRPRKRGTPQPEAELDSVFTPEEKSNRRRGKPRKNSGPANDCVALIRLDTADIRKEYHARCRKAKSIFERYQEDWRLHNEECLPAYNRWLHSEFGPSLSKLKEMQIEHERKLHIIEQMSNRHYFHNTSWHVAYREVMEEIEAVDNPVTPDDDAYESEDSGEDEGGVKDDAYEDMMDLFGNMLGGGMEPDVSVQERDDSLRQLKDVYREICKKLHPDTGGEFDQRTSALWHDAQEAYKDEDIDKLRSLLAVCEMRGGAVPSTANCWQILEIQSHFKSGVQSLRSVLRDAKRHPGWDFINWSGKDLEQRRRRVAVELENDIIELTDILEETTAKLDRLRTPPAPKRSKGKDDSDAPFIQPGFEF